MNLVSRFLALSLACCVSMALLIPPLAVSLFLPLNLQELGSWLLEDDASPTACNS